MKHYLYLFLFTFALPLAFAEPTASPLKTTVPSDEHYTTRLEYQTAWEDYQHVMEGRTTDLIFIGDSITQQWRWGQGKSIWEKNYAARALDFGQGGDQTQHTLWRLRNLDIKKYQPKIAVILIGTNNFQDELVEIASGVKAVVTTAQEIFPGIKIVLVSILPSKRAFDKMNAVNAIIQKYCDDRSVYYLDLADKFPRQGESWSGLQKDQLHLTHEGYEVWCTELNKLLARIK